jgi:hypothetical protein
VEIDSNEEKTKFNRSRVGRMFHVIFHRNSRNQSFRFNFQIFFQKAGETPSKTDKTSWEFFIWRQAEYEENFPEVE